MQRGQVLILAILGIAVAMASYTCWHHYRKGYHALRMWGTESATLIRHAQQVRLLKLAPSSGSREENHLINDRIRIGEEDFTIVQARDISTIRGLVHARHTLIVDRSFDWDRNVTSAPAEWEFALEFSDQDQHVTLVFALQQRIVHNLQTGQQQAMNETLERIAEYLKPQLVAMTTSSTD